MKTAIKVSQTLSYPLLPGDTVTSGGQHISFLTDRIRDYQNTGEARMHQRTHTQSVALVGMCTLMACSSALADGFQPDATLEIGVVDARPGETVLIPFAMETQEMVGEFGFRVNAEDNMVNDVVWDGALFSNGWTGWDNASSTTVTVSAACIFTEDQVEPGYHHLINVEFTVPEDATPGSFIPMVATDMMFRNYDFDLGTVEVDNGGINVKFSADLNSDGIVDAADIGMLLAEWGAKGSAADLNGDGHVGGDDLGEMLSAWGTAG